jgi:hypothetical protein
MRGIYSLLPYRKERPNFVTLLVRNNGFESINVLGFMRMVFGLSLC